MDPRSLLRGSFQAAVDAADPRQVLPPHLPGPPHGRTLVVGGGKAAASMAMAVEAHWPADAPLSGLVVTRYLHGLPTQRIEVVEASHPLPDERGEAAALRMLDMCRQLGPDDLLLALVSGGGSSLLAAPVEGVTLKELRQLTQTLLHVGASIQDINTVRKHLTRLSGGQLARAAQGAQGLALIISDVVGDDPGSVASGPCAPDTSSCSDALEQLQRWRITLPPGVRHHLEACAAGRLPDTPRSDDPCFVRMENRVIAQARGSLMAAVRYFEQHGVTALLLSDKVTGDAQSVAHQHAALAHAQARRRPLALISGGETTVALRPGSGRGGRNSEYLLALALALGETPAWGIACDTDGIDGSEDNAGAVLTPDTLVRARASGVDAAGRLAGHDSYGFFSGLGDLVVTGPTRTNVNDYRVLLLGLS
ncbi:MAG: glycerate kinase [Thiobacillus sp. 63-78]|uniref:glycerate kinase type-2 family protein n=1 Tax=Thiobacillus sp. 63-78 TaxID=1895859 RepID=UPI0009591F6E|nr:glycerate kinase [Thiobacillus sp. 63-78]MBN8772869.1 glycerate kinase [Thiobacillus sp.]OJZ10473.1 MAG: glycerate kinase [Thiobacillus sp. 63-78]